MNQRKSGAVRLYVMEEEETYREIYSTVLPSRVPVEVLEVSSSGDIGALRKAVLKLSPDVVLLSIKKLEAETTRELEKIRIDYPEIGIVLMLAFCSAQDIESLRKLALIGDGGMALFLKQPLDQIERLCRAIPAVTQGRVILDLPLTNFKFAGKSESLFLRQLTPRELEILGLLAQGYTNAAIAQALYIDIKTVEHHLNSMYNKLKAAPEFRDKHLRVSAAKLYLETIVESGCKEDVAVRSPVNRR